MIWERLFGPNRAVVEVLTVRPGFRWKLVQGNVADPWDIHDDDDNLAYGEAFTYQSAMTAAGEAAERRLSREAIEFEPDMTLSPDDARRALLRLPDGRLVDVVSSIRCLLCEYSLVDRPLALVVGANERLYPAHASCAAIEKKLIEEGAEFDDEVRATELEATASMRDVEERTDVESRRFKHQLMAELSDTGITAEQLNQLGWEYLDQLGWSGGGTPQDSPAYRAWIRERLARGPVEDDGGAAMRRVKRRMGIEHEA